MNELERKRLATRAVLAELDECDREIRKIEARKAEIMRRAKKAGVYRKEIKAIRAERRKRRLETRYGPPAPKVEDFME